MEALIASYLRRDRIEQRRLYETTLFAVNAGMNGDAKPFDEVFPDPQPQPKPDAADESVERWW